MAFVSRVRFKCGLFEFDLRSVAVLRPSAPPSRRLDRSQWKQKDGYMRMNQLLSNEWPDAWVEIWYCISVSFQGASPGSPKSGK